MATIYLNEDRCVDFCCGGRDQYLAVVELRQEADAGCSNSLLRCRREKTRIEQEKNSILG